MLDFRKVLLAIGVGALGLVGTASAQVICPSSSLSTTTVGNIRADGVNEMIPGGTAGIVFGTACTGTFNTASISITLQTSLPITNAPLTGTTSGQVDASATATFGTGTPITVIGTLSGASSLTFNFTATGTQPIAGAALTNITINNVRVNASVVATQTAVTATVVATSGLAVTGGSAASTVAYTAATFTKPVFQGYTNVAACNVGANDINVAGVVTITENFFAAFTQDADQAAQEATFAGTLGTLTNPITAAGGDQGLHFALTFSNLASAGVTYYLPVTVTNGTLTLTLVASATTDQSKPVTAVSIGKAGGLGNAPANPQAGVFAFTPTGGSFTAYYAVTADSQAGIDATLSAGAVTNAATPASEIVLFETIANPSLVVAGGTAPTVTVTSVGNTAPLYAEFAAPASPITVTATNYNPTTGGTSGAAAGNGSLSTCNTTVLFPYVVNQGGYDTGVAISNASTIPSGASQTAYGTAAATSGACSAYFYGTNPPSTNPYAMGTIASGATSAFDIQTVAPNFAGYVVVTCNFTGAHGYAFISNGLGTGNGTSTSYLGVILGDPALATVGVTAQ